MYLTLVGEFQPVLLLHSEQVGVKPFEALIRDSYGDQFYGDYTLWLQQHNKTLILDNMTDEPHLVELVVKAKAMFDKVVITLSSDFYYSYYRDDLRLSEYRQLKIEPLTRSQQETLIRKRARLSQGGESLSDGYVDQVERDVDSVLVAEKVLPRYPFFVLTILQTYEAFMPSNLSVTSYGHCYYVLIVANLLRARITNTDDAINACFNFAEQLAFAIYIHRERNDEEAFRSAEFIENYRQLFFIQDSTINRLRHREFGILDDDGLFKTGYMYYYFLGRFLAGHKGEGERVVSAMCDATYKEANYLTLLFTIHHTNDKTIVDDILLRTMSTLDTVSPAALDAVETKRFRNILSELPESILSQESVQGARDRERNLQDRVDSNGLNVGNESSDVSEGNSANMVYRLLKNNRILGQILRNRHGNLERVRIEEIIEIIADSGLRLVNLILKDEEEIADLCRYINNKNPEWDMERIKLGLEYYSFIWTMWNVEQIVNAINVPDIREAVDSVVRRAPTPAFDLIGYFNQLDGAQKLSRDERNELRRLYKKHEDVFVRRVLSLRTQSYMNTHRSSARIEQAVCSLLEVKYLPRPGAKPAG